jgi:hypothetical protein
MTWHTINQRSGHTAVADALGIEVANNNGMSGYAWLNVDTGAIVALFATHTWRDHGAYELWHVIGGRAIRVGHKPWTARDIDRADEAQLSLLAVAASLVPPAAEEAARHGIAPA